MRSAPRVLPAMVALSTVLALALIEVGRVSARMVVAPLMCQSGAGGAGDARPAIKVVVDALQPGVRASEDAAKVCGVEPDAAPRWRALMRPGGARVVATCDSPAVRVYAARCQDGLIVALANQGDEKAAIRLSFMASPGIYTFEKVTLDTRSADTALRFERLQGSVIGVGGRGEKLMWLPAHVGDVIRLVNRGAQVERSYRDLRQAVAALRASNPHQYRRLMPELRECEDHVAAIAARGASRDVLARHAHRALLQLALVQAFVRNAGGQSELKAPDAGSVSAKSETFEAALTELSAAALGLVANVNVDVLADGTIRESLDVANNGSAGMSVVKVWPTGPSGTTVRPPEPKLLGSLQPGRTARAVFSIHLPSGASTGDLVAHVSYHFGGSPAHLRLQAP